jgi:hypothetical protein
MEKIMAKDFVKLHLPFFICLSASLASFIPIRLYCGLERNDLDDQSKYALAGKKTALFITAYTNI